MMNQDRSKGWGYFGVVVSALMSSHAGCSAADVSMGRDHLQATGGTSGTGSVPLGDGAAAGGGVEAASCDGFENTRSRRDVTVRYVNAGTHPIYVGPAVRDCGGDTSNFELLDSTDRKLSFGGGDCISCERLQAGPMQCPLDCPQRPLVRIDPGGSHDFAWPGTYWQTAGMPRECYAPGNESWVSQHDTCPRLVQAEAASYRVAGTAWSDFLCNDGEMQCECTESAAGSCVWSHAGTVAGSSRRVSATLEVPGAQLLELRFE